MVADRGVSWVVMADRRVSRDVVANRGVSKRTEELFERFVVVVGMSVAHLAFFCTRPLLTRVCNRLRIFFGQFLTKNKDQLDLSVLYDSISLPPKSYFLLKL